MRVYDWNGRWLPEGTTRISRRLEVGDLVALDYRAWRVWDVRLLDVPEDQVERLEAYRPEVRDRYLPYKFAARREHGPKLENDNSARDAVFSTSNVGHRSLDIYENDRVPLCSCCQHPWPCRMLVAEAQAEQSARVMNERMGRMAPGICYGCGEVITSRQQSIGYPDGEGNVDLPGAPTPRFHARRSCADERRGYEKRRAALIPSAPTSDQEVPLW